MNSPDAFILSPGDERTISLGLCWWLVPDNSVGCSLLLHGDDEQQLKLGPFDTGILGFRGRQISVSSGSVAVLSADFISLAKLQAFIDSALSIPEPTRGEEWFGFTPLRYRKTLTPRLFESWLLTQNVRRCNESARIISLLRNTEWYWIVRFLLGAYDGEMSLKDMGEKYGLSVSHFRRLCKAALGNSTKEEMCHWRLARALLDMMENGGSITDIAFKHGYASLSHFSKDVKTVLGLPPRDIRNSLNIL